MHVRRVELTNREDNDPGNGHESNVGEDNMNMVRVGKVRGRILGFVMVASIVAAAFIVGVAMSKDCGDDDEAEQEDAGDRSGDDWLHELSETFFLCLQLFQLALDEYLRRMRMSTHSTDEEGKRWQ